MFWRNARTAPSFIPYLPPILQSSCVQQVVCVRCAYLYTLVNSRRFSIIASDNGMCSYLQNFLLLYLPIYVRI